MPEFNGSAVDLLDVMQGSETLKGPKASHSLQGKHKPEVGGPKPVLPAYWARCRRCPNDMLRSCTEPFKKNPARNWLVVSKVNLNNETDTVT